METGASSPILYNIALESVVKEVLDNIDATGLNISEKLKITLETYTDNIIILGEIEISVKQRTEKLINKGKDIALKANEQNTKYLIISQREHV